MPLKEAGLEGELPSNPFGAVQRRIGLSVFDSTNGSREKGTRDDQGTVQPSAKGEFSRIVSLR